MSRERIRAYARAHGITVAAARERLIVAALDGLEARSAGGSKSRETMTAEQRSARARLAAAARWLDGETWPLETAGLPPGAVVRFARTPGGLIATFSATCPTCGESLEHAERVTAIPARVAADVPCCGLAISFRLDLEGLIQS